MKKLNPLFKRYLLYTAALIAVPAFWAVFNGFTQASIIKSSFEYTEMAARYSFDVRERVQYDLSRAFVSLIDMYLLQISAVSAMLCLLFHMERKQLYPGFLNVLPVRRKDFFYCAAALGFAYVVLAQIFLGLSVMALARYAQPLYAYMYIDTGAFYGFVAKYFFSRFGMSLCFYGMCLLFQQLFNKPIVAAAVACGCAAVPQLIFGLADKFLYALGHHGMSRSVGWFSQAVINSFSGNYSSYQLLFAYNGTLLTGNWYLLIGGLYIVLAAVFFMLALALAPKAPAYAVGLYGFKWVKPAVMTGFVICTAAAFANFLPRFMGIDVMDFPAALMLQLFGLGLVAGYYAFNKLGALLDN